MFFCLFLMWFLLKNCESFMVLSHQDVGLFKSSFIFLVWISKGFLGRRLFSSGIYSSFLEALKVCPKFLPFQNNISFSLLGTLGIVPQVCLVFINVHEEEDCNHFEVLDFVFFFSFYFYSLREFINIYQWEIISCKKMYS